MAKLNKNLIIGAIVALLIVGGAGIFLLTNNGSNDPSSSSSDSSSPAFTPLATAGSSFEANYIFTSADGAVVTGLMQVDKNGDSKYSSETDGKAYVLYNIDGYTISCNDGTCYKLPSGQSSEAPDSKDYEYTDDNYKDFQNNATYKGKADCPAGTCSVWEIANEDSTSTTMYIDGDNRISKVVGDSEDGKYEMTYTYKEVTISAPENVTELPSWS